MATGTSTRKSFLTLTPIDFSLTEDTNIPAPLKTPPRATDQRRSPSPILARPPTSGGGPLSSHPTSADDIHTSAAFPPTPDLENDTLAKMSTSTSSNERDNKDMSRADSFREPASPASPNQQNQGKAARGPRKLFSLNNLRTSFGGSRTSLHSRPSTDTSAPKQSEPYKRPTSRQNLSPQQQQPQMRPRAKSGSWFRRKSGMFMLNGGGDLDAVDENKPAPTREDAMKNIKREDTKEERRSSEEEEACEDESFVEYSPIQRTRLPMLPEINTLSNDTTNGGGLGWDEDMFKK